jgi:hypothetical protein
VAVGGLFGVALLTPEVSSIDDLVAVADEEEMYRANR